VIELRNLNKTYPQGTKKLVIFSNVNIIFPNTGLMAIVGKSGSGKSTLLNLLSGLDYPTSGMIYIDKKAFLGHNYKVRCHHLLRKCGFIYQHYNLIPNLSIYDNVVIGSVLLKDKPQETKNKFDKLCEVLNIKELIAKPIAVLSGGEKQRVAIARALINNPDVIFADEPTGALDEINSEKIMEILREISKQRLVLMVTHNLLLARKYCQGIYYLDHQQLRYENLES
jgi:putative ABC transport system permease protein